MSLRVVVVTTELADGPLEPAPDGVIGVLDDPDPVAPGPDPPLAPAPVVVEALEPVGVPDRIDCISVSNVSISDCSDA